MHANLGWQLVQRLHLHMPLTYVHYLNGGELLFSSITLTTENKTCLNTDSAFAAFLLYILFKNALTFDASWVHLHLDLINYIGKRHFFLSLKRLLFQTSFSLCLSRVQLTKR